MLGMIANRDLDGYEDLLDPDNKPSHKAKEGTPVRKSLMANRLGIKSVRFDLNVKYIEPKTSYEDLYENEYSNPSNWGPQPRAGMFKKTQQKVRDSPVRRLRTPMPESDGPTYDELTDENASLPGSKTPAKPEEKTRIDTRKKETNAKQKTKNESNKKRSKIPVKRKDNTSESSIEMVIPKHNNIGDIKRFHNRSRFQNGIDHQPEKRVIKTNDENHYYYDPNHEMSEYYYYYDSDIVSQAKLKTENSVSMNRKKRRLQKLKQMRADKEHTERINLQKRYDALEDQVGTKVKMEDDSDIAVGEGTFTKSDKKLHFGKRQLDGFQLAKKDVDGFYEVEEEFTEDLSSDSTGLSPPIDKPKRPAPLLNIGATDKKFKDFGPALEFEANNEKIMEINECEDLLPEKGFWR